MCVASLLTPASLVQRENLPLGGVFDPDAAYQMRAVAMPERSYFSFKREGNVLKKILEKYGASEKDGHGWSLCFRNSTFGGEFVQTLVESLDRHFCVSSINFMASPPSPDESTNISTLVSLLPSSVHFVVFDGVLSQKALKTLIILFKNATSTPPVQGLGVLNSSHLKGEDFDMLFSLLGGDSDDSKGNLGEVFVDEIDGLEKCLLDQGFVEEEEVREGRESTSSLTGEVNLRPPVLPLSWLDLSGNKLGDSSCADLLKVALGGNSCLVSLDLSGNNINKGVEFSNILKLYSNSTMNRRKRRDGGDRGSLRSRSLLSTLILDSNYLKQSVAIQILESVSSDMLNLELLSLANNGLTDRKNFKDVVKDVLERETKLAELNLSKNAFGKVTLDEMLFGLLLNKSPSVCVLKLDGNSPGLSEAQKGELRDGCLRARSIKIGDWLVGGGGGAGGKPLPVAEAVVVKTETQVEGFGSSGGGSGGGGRGELVRSQTEEGGGGGGMGGGGGEPRVASVRGSRGRRSTSEPVPMLRGVGEEGGEQEKKVEEEATGGVKGGGVDEVVNKLTVLFSAPLIHRGLDGEYGAIELLDFPHEKEILVRCFKEASRDISLDFDTATTQQLRTHVTLGCRALHFSGHGHQGEGFLVFEDGKGGVQFATPKNLRDLCGAGTEGEDSGLKFVFVSACYSDVAGKAFVDAGVDHVVCCKHDLLLNTAALAFERAFYLALAVGQTVRDAFMIGKQAVNTCPDIGDAEAEMEKFKLLPEGANHNVRIFDARRLGAKKENSFKLSLSLGRNLSGNGGGGEGEKKRCFGVPLSPEDFMGREVDMWKVLNTVLKRRLTTVVGQTGIGRSSMVSWLCLYMAERSKTTLIDRIFFVSSRGRRGNDFLKILVKQMGQAGLIDVKGQEGLDNDDRLDLITERLGKIESHKRVMLVFDHIDDGAGAGGGENGAEFKLFLTELFTKCANVKVLVTAKKKVGLRHGAGEFVHELKPLSLKSSVKLFLKLCPHVHTGADRKEIYEALVEDGQENLNYMSASARAKTIEVLSMIGEGFPDQVVDKAYKMGKREFESLKKVGGVGGEERGKYGTGGMGGESFDCERLGERTTMESNWGEQVGEGFVGVVEGGGGGDGVDSTYVERERGSSSFGRRTSDASDASTNYDGDGRSDSDNSLQY